MNYIEKQSFAGVLKKLFILKIVLKLIGKQLCQSLHLIMLQAYRKSIQKHAPRKTLGYYNNV